MTTFGLVHGAWHGAWCYERLVPELEAAGHRAVAIDLPCDDASVDFSGYARVIESALADEDDVILVGHSLGGMSVPLVAASRPLRHLVFLCALLPVPGKTLFDQFAIEADMFAPELVGAVERDPETGLTEWSSPEAAIASLYWDCDPDDAQWAVGMLRGQSMTPHAEPCPLETLPDVQRTYIVGTDDRAVATAWSRRAAPERLGVTPVEIEGGHSPFLARPAELARVLVGLA